MSSASCLFCSYTARVDNVNVHTARSHHEEMMADVDQAMAKIAIRSKTPLMWKRYDNKLAYAYCLTCKKVSMGDPLHFKKRHSEKLCQSGWTTYQHLFLAKAPAEEMEAEPINEIVGSSEIPKDDSVCIELLRTLNPEFEGTVEQGIKSLIAYIERQKPHVNFLERRLDILERDKNNFDAYKTHHDGNYAHAMKVIDDYSKEIERLKTESGVEEARQKYNQAGKELRETQAELRLAEERRGNRWTEIGAERDAAVKEVKELKVKIEEMKKEWKSEKKEMELEKKELQQELEDLEEKYKKLRRSQRDSD